MRGYPYHKLFIHVCKKYKVFTVIYYNMNMYKMLSFFGLWNHRTLPPHLLINDFREVRHVSSEMSESNECGIHAYSEGRRRSPSEYEHFVYKKPGGVMLEYYNKKDVKIGYIRYYITTGQIGLFFIDEEYQNRGLGKQILSKVIRELKMNQCDEVWAVTTDNHPFWSNVYHKSFIPGRPAHPSVTGPGYFMKLHTNEKLI